MKAFHHLIGIPVETGLTVDTTIAQLAPQAVHAAFLETREKDISVVVAEGNELVELGPDNRRNVLKQLPPLQKPACQVLVIS